MKKPVRILLIAIFWIGFWQLLSAAVGEEILFPSPVSTARALLALCKTALFWKMIGTTFLRILVGILAASLLGLAAGLAAGLSIPFRELVNPLVTIIRTAPIASFIVLLVLWLKRGTVPAVIAALMVLPVFYSNVQEGIRSADPKLLEMADCFEMNLPGKIKNIYLPTLLPYLFSAAASSFGMAWKAGVAAEVIVLPVNSIGRQLYYAGSNLETEQVFAWTAAVILLSLLMDRAVSLLFGEKTTDRMRRRKNGAAGWKAAKSEAAESEAIEPGAVEAAMAEAEAIEAETAEAAIAELKAVEPGAVEAAMAEAEAIEAETAEADMAELKAVMPETAESAQEETPTAGPGAVLDHVYFSYGDKKILKNFSYTFPAGKVTAVMGPSGSGKTSLAKLLTGLEHPSAGRIITEEPQAVMFQEARLLPWFSLKKNLTAVLGKNSEETARKWLQAVGLSKEEDSLPETLSGGMRQRASLARTLAFAEKTSAPLVIIDEPFSALDQKLHTKMRELVLQTLNGRTLILITHDPADAGAADNCLDFSHFSHLQ